MVGHSTTLMFRFFSVLLSSLHLYCRLKTEHMQELHSKLKEQAEQSARELEEVMSVELSEYDALRLQKSEIELRLKLLREEMSLQCEQEKLALTETWQAERLQLEEKYAAEISNYNNMLSLVRAVLDVNKIDRVLLFIKL